MGVSTAARAKVAAGLRNMKSSRIDFPGLAQRLAAHRVFGQLDDSARQTLAARAKCTRAEAGSLLLRAGELHRQLGWVLAGGVELHDPDLDLGVRLGPDELFGAGATPLRQLRAWQATATCDSQLAWIDPEDLRRACQQHRALLYFLPSLEPEESPSPHAPPAPDTGADLLGLPLARLIRRAPVTLPPQATIGEVAETMARENISSVLLAEDGRLAGIITDRDLRNRVLAPGLARERPAADVATAAPVTIAFDRPAFEAQLLMARHQVHHLPVLQGGRIAGVLSSTDLLGHGTSAVSLAGEIHRAADVAALVRCTERVKQLQRLLAAAGIGAQNTGRMVTAITDAVTRRLLQLAHQELGPAPVDYAWVAAGSQARSEQTARTDQDNCLVLDDGYDEAAHGEWFARFARFVCDGLHACGYVYCPGEMMAMTPRWRQPRQRWIEYFRQWIDQPEPMALMLTSVFFDLRAIDGCEDLLASLRAEVLQRTRGNSLFLAHMAGNALKHRPPLGVFGNITATRGGEHAGTVDLKHAGIVPIVDLARVYALAAGLPPVNTYERLAAAPAGGEVSAAGARDLHDALEFISQLRITHQTRQVEAGEAPDNHLPLERISGFERSQLKDAFGVVRTMQSVLTQRY